MDSEFPQGPAQHAFLSPAPSLEFSERAEGIELGEKYLTIITVSFESNTSVASPKKETVVSENQTKSAQI